jgi:hypothetical protein
MLLIALDRWLVQPDTLCHGPLMRLALAQALEVGQQ